MINAMEPPGEKPARESHFELIYIVRRGLLNLFVQGAIDRIAVHSRYSGNVSRRFKATFDLKTNDTGPDQFRNFLNPGKVLRGQQIFFITQIAAFSVDDQIVRQTTGLGAFPSIRTSLSE